MSKKHPFQDPSLSNEERINDLLGRLSVSEKVGMLMHDSPAVPELDIPTYSWWNECLHGVARNGKATVFPQPIFMAASFDIETLQTVAESISDEARAKFNVAARKNNGNTEMYQGLTFWTPNVNIFRDPRWGRGHETYGEDPYLSGELGAAFVRGLQGDDPTRMKTAACAKHYAVHSGPEGLRHEFDAITDDKDLFETYLPAFKRLVDENVETVMGAYNRTNGEPCCAHSRLLGEILRGDWGFKGHVVSDCWAIRDFHEFHGVTKTPAESAALALKEGCDLNCGCMYSPHLFEAYNEGMVTEEEIDVSVRRMLDTRLKLGLLEWQDDHPFNKIGEDVIHCDKHRTLAKDIAAKSMVLLKNENEILPIPESTNSLYLSGPHATSLNVLLGNYYGMSPKLTSMLEGITERCPEGIIVNYNQGCEIHIDPRNTKTWIGFEAGKSDIVILALGIDPTYEGEEGEAVNAEDRGDRIDIKLPKPQVDFVKTIAERGTRIVCVLFGGSAIDISEINEHCEAILWAGYPGEAGGEAIAEVLFGDVSPSGKLPMTFPYEHQLMEYYDYAMEGRTYRFQKDEPLYRFGYGLSYTTFEYSGISATRNGNTLTATAKLTNTGKIEAEEVAQCYITKPGINARAAQSELGGFKRVNLKPGESVELSFPISQEQLELVQNDGSKVLENGDYKIFIGGSSPSASALAESGFTLTI